MFHFFALSGPSKSLTGERERTAAVTALARPFGAESDPLPRPSRRSQPRSELRASNGGFLNLFVFLFSPPPDRFKPREESEPGQFAALPGAWRGKLRSPARAAAAAALPGDLY